MVEVEGERVLAASCIRQPTPGMKVKTQTDRAKHLRAAWWRSSDRRPAGARDRARSRPEL
jgi:formate dehydrogenase major subunit